MRDYIFDDNFKSLFQSKIAIDCRYCGNKAYYTDSKEIYGRSHGMIYFCEPCDAYVGVHKGTITPLGILAKKDLRFLRVQAHFLFDKLWRKKMKKDKCSQGQARKCGYLWLAKMLDISPKDCHIAYFDDDICNKAIKICNTLTKQ